MKSNEMYIVLSSNAFGSDAISEVGLAIEEKYLLTFIKVAERNNYDLMIINHKEDEE